jgi:hypothetical protein
MQCLHLLAIAREAEVDLKLDDFNRIADKVPHLGDLKAVWTVRDERRGQGWRCSGFDEGPCSMQV